MPNRAVNARTGEVAGERLWSWLKITLFVLAIIAVIGADLRGTAVADDGPSTEIIDRVDA